MNEQDNNYTRNLVRKEEYFESESAEQQKTVVYFTLNKQNLSTQTPDMNCVKVVAESPLIYRFKARYLGI